MGLFDAHTYLASTPFCNAMASRDAILATFQKYNISMAAIISGLAADCDMESGNRSLQEILDPQLGLYGYVTLNADNPPASMEQQRLYLARREFVGGVLFPRHGNPVTLEDTREIITAHRRYTKPMAIYVANSEAVHAAGRIAVEYPSMKFLLLTMGGSEWHAAVATAKQYLNVYLEISGNLDADKVAQAAESLTARRVIYGSGLPFRDPELTIGLVEQTTSITRPDAARIYGQNAAMFFNVQQSQ